MKPKLIALNLVLAAGVGSIAWQGRLRWLEAQAERQANLNVRVPNVTLARVTPVPAPDAPAAVKYADVANKNLFASDRNPTVITDPVKVEAPKPMPPLPVVYGTMGLPSGTKAIMAQRAGESGKSVRAGDTIGEFKVLALSTEKVTFEWNDKQIEKRIEDLIDRSNAQPGSGRGQAAAPPPGPAVPAAAPSQAQKAEARPGAEVTPGERACTGDNSPNGTVVDGYRKQFTPSPFGAINCRWVKQ